MQTRYDRIEELRSELKISQSDLSRYVNRSRNWYCINFHNKTQLSIKMIHKLAKSLDCSFEYLAGLHDTRYPIQPGLKKKTKICYHDGCIYMQKHLDGSRFCPFKNCFVDNLNKNF